MKTWMPCLQTVGQPPFRLRDGWCISWFVESYAYRQKLGSILVYECLPAATASDLGSHVPVQRVGLQYENEYGHRIEPMSGLGADPVTEPLA